MGALHFLCFCFLRTWAIINRCGVKSQNVIYDGAFLPKKKGWYPRPLGQFASHLGKAAYYIGEQPEWYRMTLCQRSRSPQRSKWMKSANSRISCHSVDIKIATEFSDEWQKNVCENSIWISWTYISIRGPEVLFFGIASLLKVKGQGQECLKFKGL